MSYRYTIVFLDDDGRELDRVPVVPDWGMAFEWLHFEGARRGQLPALLVSGVSLPAARIEPNWHRSAGKPFVQSFRARLPVTESHDSWVEAEIPTIYLRPLAQQASARLVARGLLQSGATFRYLVAAFASADSLNLVQPRGSFALDEIIEPMPLNESPLPSFAPLSTEKDSSDFPVFIADSVIDQAIELGCDAGDKETGGFLVGRLHRDPAGEIFAAITEQLPAQHTHADQAKLTFTPATWEAASAALELRKEEGILMLGWWHVHQDLCRLRGCDFEKRRGCQLSKPFFSEDDVLLHTTCFSRPYHVGLLVSDHTADGWTATLFGWRHGMVVHRAHHVLIGALPLEGGALQGTERRDERRELNHA